jgi:hypothetical protein
LLFLPLFVLALFIQARLFGQVETWVNARSMPAWIGALAFIFGVAAFQVHGSDAAPWLGTLLSLLGFAAMLTLLNRFGRFDVEILHSTIPEA